MPRILSLDHLVLTVASIPATVAFYVDVLGMTHEVFGDNRNALSFGAQKINLHEHGNEFEPKAHAVQPGSGDLCFIVDDLEAVRRSLEKHAIPILEGPVARTGATGPLTSLYVRDPDLNLIELSVYDR